MLTFRRLNQVLDYEPSTGVFTWRAANKYNPHKGSVAGHVSKRDGYRYIILDYRHYTASRLAWFWMTGKLPAAEIDHKNTIRDDNRWRNLRPATSSQNKQNASIRINKNTPFKGVSWHKHSHSYRAYITLEGRHVSLGYFHSAEKAHAAYIQASRAHFGKYARAR